MALAPLLLKPSVCVPLSDRPLCGRFGSPDLHHFCPFSRGVLLVLLAVVARAAVSITGHFLPVCAVGAIFVACAVGAGDRLPCVSSHFVARSARRTVI